MDALRGLRTCGTRPSPAVGAVGGADHGDAGWARCRPDEFGPLRALRVREGVTCGVAEGRSPRVGKRVAADGEDEQVEVGGGERARVEAGHKGGEMRGGRREAVSAEASVQNGCRCEAPQGLTACPAAGRGGNLHEQRAGGARGGAE